MTTKKLVPRASGEGAMGVDDNAWGEAYYDTGNFNKGLFVSGHNITQVIAETVTQGGLGGEWTRNGLNIYYNGGNVGIGTTNPGGKLEVAEDNSENCSIRLRSNSQNGTILGALTELKSIGTNSTYGTDFTISNRDASDSFKERIRLVYNGNVGIGTTSPVTKLHVAGVGRFDVPEGGRSLLSWSVGATTAQNQPVFALVTNEINNADRVIFNSDGDSWFNGGNVGIGTTNPGAALGVAGSFKLNNTAGGTLYTASNDVYKNHLTSSSLKHSITLGTAGWRNASVIESVTGTAPSGFSTEGLYLNATYGSNVFTSASVHVDCNTGNGDISFLTGTGAAAPTTKFKLQNNGNVGIGTTSPDEKLVIQGGVKILSTNKLSFSNTSNQTYIHGVTSNRMAFGTNSVERIRIDEFGNVGIGTTDPGGKLHLLDSRTTTHTDYTLTVQNDGATPHGLRVHQKNADPSLTGASSGYSILTTSGSFQCFYVTNNGDTFNKYGNYGVISDKRLKENITDATAKTEDLKKVRVVNYNLIKDDTKQIGVIAQELEQVFPGLVSESEHQDGETYKSVKMSLFIPMLLKGFQEQQQLIEDLRSEVEALKNK